MIAGGKGEIAHLAPRPQPETPEPLVWGLAAAPGRVVANAYVLKDTNQKPEIPPDVILVAASIAPDWLPLLQQVVGIVTQHGGLTSHSAILARELGIPAVVNVTNAIDMIQTGDTLQLDGDRGEVYRLCKDAEEQRGRGAMNKLLIPHPSPLTPQRQLSQVGNERVDTERNSSLTPRMPIVTKLLLNISQPGLIEQVLDLPVDGVGLLRSELMVLNVLNRQHPKVWIQQNRQAELVEWQAQITQFARAFAPRPVFDRSLDWRSDEFLSHSGNIAEDIRETNPMLGNRGTLGYVKDSSIFDLELAALAAVQQNGYTNIHLLLPFVRTVEEFSFCRRRVEQAGLTQVGLQLWIMAEVPSILFLLPEYVKAGVQGVSIGTNDLTGLLLGVDRDELQLVVAFDQRHPVVMQAIAQIIQMALLANIPCSICGQAPVRYPAINRFAGTLGNHICLGNLCGGQSPPQNFRNFCGTTSS